MGHWNILKKHLQFLHACRSEWFITFSFHIPKCSLPLFLLKFANAKKKKIHVCISKLNSSVINTIITKILVSSKTLWLQWLTHLFKIRSSFHMKSRLLEFVVMRSNSKPNILWSYEYKKLITKFQSLKIECLKPSWSPEAAFFLKPFTGWQFTYYYNRESWRECVLLFPRFQRWC